MLDADTHRTEFRAKLRDIFNEFDTDGSGSVDADELESIIASLEMDISAAQVAVILQEADTDGSGVVEFNEVMLAADTLSATLPITSNAMSPRSFWP